MLWRTSREGADPGDQCQDYNVVAKRWAMASAPQVDGQDMLKVNISLCEGEMAPNNLRMSVFDEPGVKKLIMDFLTEDDRCTHYLWRYVVPRSLLMLPMHPLPGQIHMNNEIVNYMAAFQSQLGHTGQKLMTVALRQGLSDKSVMSLRRAAHAGVYPAAYEGSEDQAFDFMDMHCVFEYFTYFYIIFEKRGLSRDLCINWKADVRVIFDDAFGGVNAWQV